MLLEEIITGNHTSL